MGDDNIIVIFDSLAEVRASSNELIEKSNLVLIRNHEAKDFSILKTRNKLNYSDVMKCQIAIDLFHDVLMQDDTISLSDVARKLLEI